MSLAIVKSRTQSGMQAISVDVEVHLANGLPGFSVVGMAETAVRESKDRVRGAIVNAKFEFPARRIIVNLAPADIPKTGGRFDLPIALGILLASGQLRAKGLGDYEVMGELALSGELKGVQACLPSALACMKQGRQLLISSASASEAALIEGLPIIAVDSLADAAAHLSGQQTISEFAKDNVAESGAKYADMADICGQLHGKRALEVAAAGGHHILFWGAPGAGKTMLASRLPGILPPLSTEQALEAAAIQSVSSQGFDLSDWKQRPFRSPHHSASAVALVGGSSPPIPGEISLAHHGVLFLDELPEFSRQALEQLREPLETGYVNVVRAHHRVKFGCHTQLVASMNPCKCGYYGDSSNRCHCSAQSIENYRNRISGPLLDRIDMHVHLPQLEIKELRGAKQGESSEVIRERVTQARQRQLSRQGCINADLETSCLEGICQLDQQSAQLLETACQKMGLSARAYHRILKLSRTIADLQNSESIRKPHIGEALGFRLLVRG